MSDLPKAILAAIEQRISYLTEQHKEEYQQSSFDVVGIIYARIHEAKCIRMIIKGMIDVENQQFKELKDIE